MQPWTFENLFVMLPNIEDSDKVVGKLVPGETVDEWEAFDRIDEECLTEWNNPWIDFQDNHELEVVQDRNMDVQVDFQDNNQVDEKYD